MHPVRTDQSLGILAEVVLLAALTSWAGLGLLGWLVGLGCAVASSWLVARGLAFFDRPGLGPADWITWVRTLAVCGVTALVIDSWLTAVSVAALVVLASVALSLDAVDGWVARRTRTRSSFGARFDMEVDAFLILVLSAYVARSLGGWVLAIGLARYALWVAAWLVPVLREPVPPRYWRKVVAALQGVVLTVAASALLPRWVVTLAVIAALALLTESFGRDVRWLTHRGPSVPSGVPRKTLASVGRG